MDTGEIASRYARALYVTSEEQGVEREVYANMKMLLANFTQEQTLSAVLKNPLLEDDRKIALLKTAGGVKVDPLYEQFIEMVTRKRRESFLPFMAVSYIMMYRRKKRITRVSFAAPVEISVETEAHLKAKLNEETGDTIEFEGLIAPELIGGFRLRIGNERIDATYATELEEIRRILSGEA